MLRSLLLLVFVGSLFITPKFFVVREVRGGESEMSQGWWGAVRKMAVNTASSAASTGAVLGVHSAFGPSDGAPKVSDSQLHNPTFKTNKSLVDLEMGDGMSFFAISLGALALCLMGICVFSYCGCSPRAIKARREKEE